MTGGAKGGVKGGAKGGVKGGAKGGVKGGGGGFDMSGQGTPLGYGIAHRDTHQYRMDVETNPDLNIDARQQVTVEPGGFGTLVSLVKPQVDGLLIDSLDSLDAIDSLDSLE
jgi:hypothetical protein